MATTSQANTPRPLAGVLGSQFTNIIIGDHRVNNGVRSGFRVQGGYCFDKEDALSVLMGFRCIQSDADNFSAAATSTILARPYNDVSTDPVRAQAVLLSFPGVSTGGIKVQATVDPFLDGWADLTQTLICASWYQVDGLIGYRYYRYGEAIGIQQLVVPTGVFLPTGTQITATDSFITRNDFNGAELGFRAVFTSDELSLTLLGKVSAGHLRKQVDIKGSQTTSIPGQQPSTLSGGVLALDSNSGTYVENAWAATPEFGATFRWQATENLRLSLGYSALCLLNVVRANDQINVNINPNFFPPVVQGGTAPREPSFHMKFDDVWFQTLNFGAEFVY